MNLTTACLGTVLTVLLTLAPGFVEPADDLALADRHFKEKSYKPALEAYRAVYGAESGPTDRRGHALIRMGQCLRRLQEFDRALGLLDRELSGFGGTIWNGRAHALRGQIALTMPHSYYKKGDRISRGEWFQGATYHYTYYDDLISALKDLEAAVDLLDGTASVKSLTAEERARRSADFTKACFDMTTALEAHRNQKGGLKGLELHPDVVADYRKHGIGDRRGTDPQSYFQLASRQAKFIGRRDDHELADYLEAMYCRRLLESFNVIARVGPDGAFEFHCRTGGSDEKPVTVKLPERSDPFRLFEAFASAHPKSKLLDSVVYSHAVLSNSYERFARALSLVKDFEKRFPKSPWKSDVASLVQQITHPIIEVATPPSRLPGKIHQLELTTRNVPKLAIDVYRIDFDEIYGSRSYLDDDEANLANVEAVIKAVGVRKLRRGSPVLHLEPTTGDAGRHQRHIRTVPVALPAAGAYLIEVVGPETTVRTIALSSTLSIIRKVSEEEAIIYVSDSVSGKPVAGAEVHVRQKHRKKGLFGWFDKISWDRGETDANGLFIRRHADSEGRSISIEAFATRGDDAALTRFGAAYPRGKRRARTVHYGFTDRPVYRPGEQVGFVTTLRRGHRGDYEAWGRGESVAVTIRDPKNNVVLKESMTTDEFGSISGALSLGEEPPLGVYRIQYRDGKRHIGRTTFRVEEYKKPEFEVTVEGPDDPVRTGDEVPVRISAQYYFGGAVAEATVRYRVKRSAFRPWFRRNARYDWFFDRRSRYPGYGGDELLFQGEGVTDAHGMLEVLIPTEDLKKSLPLEDHRIVVEADVMDLSRRTISGSGQVVVPRRGLFAQLTPDRGFYRAGEKASIGVRTQTPNGKPVASRGTIIISRVTATRAGDEIEETLRQLSSDEFEVGERGEATFEWLADAPGRFSVRYVTRDRWSESVVGESRIWVTAPNYRAADFQFKNIEVMTDREEYRPGDVAYVLLNSTFPDGSVFVTLEADRQILKHQVVELTGKTQVLTIPIEKRHAPNIHLHAMCARNGQFFESSQEIFVPPTHEFLNVDVAFDQKVYQPGAPARVGVRCTDENGKPVDAQFALRVMDESISYIQPDSTPDIRRFFYGALRSFHGTSRWNANTINSLQFGFQSYVARNREWRQYRNHGLPRGWYLDTSNSWGDTERSLASRFESKGLLDDTNSDMLSEAGVSEAAPAARSRLGAVGRMAEAKKSRDAPVESEEVAEEALQAPELRENFATIANWTPHLRTGADGTADVTFKLPDSLTSWVATARGMTRDTRVGQGESTARTTKRVLARLQAPRFLTERDEIVLSGLIRNDHDVALAMEVELAIDGSAAELVDEGIRSIEIPAGKEMRLDWTARAVASGEVSVSLSALSSVESDAMMLRVPVLAYGIDKVVTQVHTSQGASEVFEIPIDLPDDRRISSTALEVTLSPSLASTMLDALPYLVEFPYGCTEQTTSRFLPAVMVARTMREMGISLEDVAKKRRDLAQADLLNSGKIAPVYDQRRLESIVEAGVRRLRSMQNSDGGFGWWAQDRSSLRLSAYVVYGLSEARAAGFMVPGRILERALDYLEGEIKESRSTADIGFAAFALSAAGREPQKALDHVFERRDSLSNLAKAQLALSLHAIGDSKRAELVLRNVRDFVQRDEVSGTCHWPAASSWWSWQGDEIETNAWMLLAHARIDPHGDLNEPLARWMVNNRSGNRWKSTRDTAASVLALCEYMKGAGELTPSYSVTLSYADLPAIERSVTRENMLAFDNRIILRGDALRSGTLPLRVSKEGEGRLYVTTRLIYFSTEERISGAGHEIEVSRRYYHLKPYEATEERRGRPVKVTKYERTLLESLADATAGDEIEVVLSVTSRNDYEYIMVEDRKPSGFEPVALRSGRRYGNGLCSNMELRDERVVFFVSWLQQGQHEISYRMRAEAPGVINAMPCRAVSMYTPRLGGISDSWHVKVVDGTN